MLGIIIWNTRDDIRWILNDRTKERLLPKIKKYILTNDDFDKEIENENENIKTRIFSAFLRSYRFSDLEEFGYILK